ATLQGYRLRTRALEPRGRGKTPPDIGRALRVARERAVPCATGGASSAPWLEQLDRGAGGIVDDDLRGSRSRHDLARAERHARSPQPSDLRLQILHLEVDAVPAARCLMPAIGERALS